jgi:hypothetical protein
MNSQIIEGKFVMTVEQAHDFHLAAQRAGLRGGDVESFVDVHNLRKLLPFFRGHSEVRPIDFVIDFDAPPVVPKGYVLRSHHKTFSGKGIFNRIGDKLLLFDGKTPERWRFDLHLVSHQTGEKTVDGSRVQEEIEKVRRNKTLVLDVNCRDLFIKNPQLIPESLRRDNEGNSHWIYFWGTTFCDRDGREHVPYLCYFEGQVTCSGYVSLISIKIGKTAPAAVLRRTA